MIGSIMLVVPITVMDCGLLFSYVWIVPIAICSWKTAAWYAMHSKNDEIDISIPVRRVLGTPWYYVI